MKKINCYIEEYEKDGKTMARLRDKETDKIVVITGNNVDKNHFLRFLSQARLHNDVMPTIFEKNGLDSVAVRGDVFLETEEEINISVDVESGGYLFE